MKKEPPEPKSVARSHAMNPMVRTRWERAALDSARVHTSEAAFLSEVGLPNLDEDDLAFSTVPLLPGVEGTDCHWVGVYGNHGDLPLYVRESVAGVWTIDIDSGRPLLINSTGAAFSRFIGLRRKYLFDYEKYMPPRVREDLVQVVKRAMEERDPVAMKESCLWPPFIEDLANQAAWYD